MIRKISPLLAVSCAALLLNGCTLEPIGKFHGHDLLDDTPEKPVVELTAKDAYRTSSDKVATPYVAKEVTKEATKPAAPAAIPAMIKAVEAPKEAVKADAPKVAPVKTEMAKTETAKKETVKTEGVKAVPIVTCPTEQKPIDAKAADVPPPRAPVEAIRHNTIVKGDRVKITVFREKDLTNTYQISDQGALTFPLLGQVQANGLTASQLEEKLTKGLSAGYLVKPQVTVEQLPDCNSK